MRRIATRREQLGDDRAEEDLDDEVDVEVVAQLAAVDAAAQDDPEGLAPRAQDGLVDRRAERGVVARLGQQLREDAERVGREPPDAARPRPRGRRGRCRCRGPPG